MSTQGKRTKEIRLQLNLTQEDMGRIFNTSKSYISLVERDRCNFTVSQLVKLLLDYNVDLNYLLGGIGSPFIHSESIKLRKDILSDIEKILKCRGI